MEAEIGGENVGIIRGTCDGGNAGKKSNLLVERELVQPL
jgi:hypothetical protein